MNQLIKYMLYEISEQYRELVTDRTTQIMADLDYLYQHNMAKLTALEIIAWCSLAFGILALGLLIYQALPERKRRHR